MQQVSHLGTISPEAKNFITNNFAENVGESNWWSSFEFY